MLFIFKFLVGYKKIKNYLEKVSWEDKQFLSFILDKVSNKSCK